MSPKVFEGEFSDYIIGMYLTGDKGLEWFMKVEDDGMHLFHLGIRVERLPEECTHCWISKT